MSFICEHCGGKILNVKHKVNIENGIVFKPWEVKDKKEGLQSKFEILNIIKKHNWDFFPKVLEWNEKGYSYEYVEGDTLAEYYDEYHSKTDTKFTYEVKIALDNIWKELYNLSMKLWNGEWFLYHSDLHSNNMIYDQASRKLILIDLNSMQITNYIPFNLDESHKNLWGLGMAKMNIEEVMHYKALFGQTK
tara:strand:+ start:423 stop:995 length:573 start_codon:yes stop_codon:yes gene_type:complete